MSKIAEVIHLISETLNISPENINENTFIQDIAAWDSIVSLQLMIKIEKTFAVQIPLYQFLQAKQLKDVIQLVK